MVKHHPQYRIYGIPRMFAAMNPRETRWANDRSFHVVILLEARTHGIAQVT